MTASPEARVPPRRPAATAVDVASGILAAAERDVAFVVKIVGESQQMLIDHFLAVIEIGLAGRDITYGDHPLLRVFIEAHASELAEFVQNGIALQHRFGLRAFEQDGGDPLRLFRVDLWDSLRSHIIYAERHFLDGSHGLQKIVAEVRAFQAERAGPTADG